MSDFVPMRGPVSVANLAAAAGVTTTDDGWWPCLDIAFRTPVPPSITKITAQVRERGADGRYSQPAETVLTKAEIVAGAAKIVNGVSVGQHLEVRLSPAGAPGVPFQATPWLEVTTSWDALIAALDGLKLGCFTVVCGEGVPTRTDLPGGSLYVEEGRGQLWQYEQGSPTGGIVGANVDVSSRDGSIVMPATIPAGCHVVAVAIEWPGLPSTNTGDGWTGIASNGAYGTDASVCACWKYFPAGGAALQHPFNTSNVRVVAAWIVRGLDPTFTPDLYSIHYGGAGSYFGPTVTDSSPTAGLYLFGGAACPIGTADPGTASHSNTTDFTVDSAKHVAAAGGVAMRAAFTSAPVSVSDTVSWSGGGFPQGYLMIGLSMGSVDPTGSSTPPAEWVLKSDLTSIRLNGVEIEGSPRSIDFQGDFDVATDGLGHVTVSLTTSPAPVTVPLAIGSNPPTLVAGADGRLIPVVWE